MQWAYKMLGPLFYLPTPFAEKTPKMVRGIPLDIARDELVKLALEDPQVTHMLWVDSDEICESPMDPNEALRNLLQCDAPIVSGLYRAKQKEGFNYAAWMDAKLPNKKGYIPIQSYTGNFIQVDVVGFGFCLTKREVFEKVEAPWFPWNSVSPSEDFNFCEKAREKGYAINVFTDVKLKHEGNLMVNCDGTIKVLEV
jgi:GT2 family glycosyltransferase